MDRTLAYMQSLESRKTPQLTPPSNKCHSLHTKHSILGCFRTFFAISRLNMVRFSVRKKLLEKEIVPSKPTKPANVLGRLLGVLWYIGPFFFPFFFTLVLFLLEGGGFFTL